MGGHERFGLPAVATAFRGIDDDTVSCCVEVRCGAGLGADLGGRGVGINADLDGFGLAIRRWSVAEMHLAVRISPGEGRWACSGTGSYQQ